MEDPRIISALFIFLKMAYYNVLINRRTKRLDTQHNRAAYPACLEAAERGNGGVVL